MQNSIFFSNLDPKCSQFDSLKNTWESGEKKNDRFENNSTWNRTSKYEFKYNWIYFSSAKGGCVCKHCEFLDGSGKTNACSSPFVMGIQLGSHPTRKLEKHREVWGAYNGYKNVYGGFTQSQPVLQMVWNQERLQIAEDKGKIPIWQCCSKQHTLRFIKGGP